MPHPIRGRLALEGHRSSIMSLAMLVHCYNLRLLVLRFLLRSRYLYTFVTLHIYVENCKRCLFPGSILIQRLVVRMVLAPWLVL